VARDDDKGVERRSLNWRVIGAIVLALLVVDFMVQNNNTVDVHFLFFSREAHVWVVLLITGVLAVVAVELVASHLRRNRDKKD
jgi:uncharacterized integral membrane protein